MYKKPIAIFFIIIFLNLVKKKESRFEFTNFVCEIFDKSFGEFEYCYLKSINRSYKYISGRLKLSKLPITKMMVNMALWKRFNGYKPFLYNVTFDVCTLLRKPSFNPVVKFWHDIQRFYSNVNQSCPLNHDVILDKMPIDYVNHRLSKTLPFPEGDYLFKMYFLRSKNRTALCEIYGTLS